MLKKTFSVFLLIITVILSFCFPLTASAYEVMGFDVSADAGMLVSLDTQDILYSNNIDKKVYPASITKIMTAVLMLESEKYNPQGKVTMTEEVLKMVSGTGSVVSHIKAGEEFTQLDLLYLVLMSSSGDCAYLAAEFYGGSVENFVSMMNQKAVELELTSTRYANPVGLHDENNYTTVRDIYTLASYAIKNDTFMTVCEATKYTMPATNMSGERTFSTTNFLQEQSTNYYYKYAKGVKTGYTDEAGRCLVSTASYNGYNYMCILMGCPANAGKRYEFADSANLYRWAFNNFSFRNVAESDKPVCEIKVEMSLDADFVPLYFEKAFVSILPNDADDSTIIVKHNLKSESINAPVKKGDILGTADIIYAEQVLGTVNLVAGNDVKQSRLLTFFNAVKNIFTSIYMKIFIGFIISVIVIFIIICLFLNASKLKKKRAKYIPYKEEKERKNNHVR